MPRQKKMVHVLRVNSDDLPDRLDLVAEIFRKAWDDTPEEYRDDMAFYKWGNTYYDSPYVEFEAYYMLDETDEEMAEREARERNEAAATEAKERAVFEMLKHKFG